MRPALAHKTTRWDSGLVQGSGNDLPSAILPASWVSDRCKGLCESEGSVWVRENGLKAAL